MRKALVIYDTVYGNSKEVAETIAWQLQEEFDAKAEYLLHININELETTELLILGSPTHYWQPSSRMREFLQSISKLRFRPYAACFCTKMEGAMSGSAAEKMHTMLRKIGMQMVLQPLNLYVETTQGPLKAGEKQTAQRFADAIKQRFKAA